MSQPRILVWLHWSEYVAEVQQLHSFTGWAFFANCHGCGQSGEEPRSALTLSKVLRHAALPINRFV